MIRRKKPLSRVAVAALAIVTLTLTACAPEKVAASGPEGFVQDLWMFDQIVAINVDDERIDLTEAIVANFEGVAPDSTIELMDGVTFYEYAALSPMIIDTESDSTKARSDVVMTAGFIETVDGRNLTILASPNPGTKIPIYFKDVVKFDLTFLGDLIQPGDPLLFDYAFVQAFPTLDAAENGMSSLELLRHRMRNNSIQYFGDEVGGEPTVSLFTQELGVVLQGSNWGAYPAKSQDMLDGFEAGIVECGKKTRGAPVKCVEKFLDKMFEGSAKSWQLIDDQLDYVTEEVNERRKEAAADRTNDRRRHPSPAQPAKCTPPAGADDAEEGGEGGGTAESPNCPPDPPPGGSGESGNNGTNGTVGGDPHFRTFDGKRFDMHGVGEYLVASHESLTVQVRTAPVASAVTSLSAVALGFGDHTMTIEAAQLHIDGTLVTDELIELDGVSIVNKNHIVTVQFDNGQLVRVVNSWRWVLDLEIWNPVRGEWSGLLGDADGDPANDSVTRSGKGFAKKLTFEQMYQEFSESWRVSQAESLFHYAAGENTETFTDRSMPRAPFTVDDLPAEHRKQAERMCRAAGIQDPDVFQNCVLDYGLLGELGDASVPGQLGTLRSAKRADLAEAFISGQVDTLGQRPPARTDTKTPGGGATRPGTGDDTVDLSAWRITGTELLVENKARAGITCPAGGEFGPVWGGYDAYAMESSVCTSAVHAGVITLNEGGFVMVTRLHDANEDIDYSGFDGFFGYPSHGVTSKSKPAGPAFNFTDGIG